MSRKGQGLRVDQPATYEIRVRGWVDDRWTEWLGGLRIVLDGRGEDVTTVLTGDLADQAALLGLLESLYNLGYPILGVRLLLEESRSPRSDGESARDPNDRQANL